MLATRNSVFTFLLGLPFERAIKWHLLMALVTEGLSVYHGLIALGLWSKSEGRKGASDLIWYSGGCQPATGTQRVCGMLWDGGRTRFGITQSDYYYLLIITQLLLLFIYYRIMIFIMIIYLLFVIT